METLHGFADELCVRGVAQPGRVLRSGRRSRRFESSHPDQIFSWTCLAFVVGCAGVVSARRFPAFPMPPHGAHGIEVHITSREPFVLAIMIAGATIA